MQSTNSEYGSPYLVVCHFTLQFTTDYLYVLTIFIYLFILSIVKSLVNIMVYYYDYTAKIINQTTVVLLSLDVILLINHKT